MSTIVPFGGTSGRAPDSDRRCPCGRNHAGFLQSKIQVCVCGHVREHHRTPSGSDHRANCQWGGCGCPRFVDGAE